MSPSIEVFKSRLAGFARFYLFCYWSSAVVSITSCTPAMYDITRHTHKRICTLWKEEEEEEVNEFA